MKQVYETPEVEIIVFETEDVIKGSNDTSFIPDGESLNWP